MAKRYGASDIALDILKVVIIIVMGAIIIKVLLPLLSS